MLFFRHCACRHFLDWLSSGRAAGSGRGKAVRRISAPQQLPRRHDGVAVYLVFSNAKWLRACQTRLWWAWHLMARPVAASGNLRVWKRACDWSAAFCSLW